MRQSEKLFHQAQQCIPGGVNSPVRAFKGVGGTPIFFESGEGAYLLDVDGHRYVDYVGSWGPLILGHAHPKVVQAIQKTIEKGLSFGAPTELEISLAEKITQLIPSIEMVRCVNSGTEATMSAIRLARAATGRDKILKFEGCYHGHSDSLLVKAGSGALTFGVPSSPGVPDDLAKHTLTVSYNHLDEVEKVFKEVGKDIAAIIVEPVAGNMNCILPLPGFLKGLREICDRYGSLLIFDEVITGFRVGLSGAQALYQITPDLTTLGKIIGGGMPVGAYGGKRKFMEQIAPVGSVYQAGTLAGNPVAMAAGLATLNEISQPHFYEKLEKFNNRFVEGLLSRAKDAKVPLVINHISSIFGLFFTHQPSVHYYKDVIACSVETYQQFFHGMLQEGIYFAPSAFEIGLVSSAHDEEALTKTFMAAEKVFSELKRTKS